MYALRRNPQLLTLHTRQVRQGVAGGGDEQLHTVTPMYVNTPLHDRYAKVWRAEVTAAAAAGEQWAVDLVQATNETSPDTPQRLAFRQSGSVLEYEGRWIV
jgi:hypothetical protein